jgi:hypothetical protein
MSRTRPACQASTDDDPPPIEDADLQTGEAIFTTAGDPPAGPRRFRLDASPRSSPLSVSEAGGSGRGIMRVQMLCETIVANGGGRVWWPNSQAFLKTKKEDQITA